MRQIEVVLGGQKITVTELPGRRNAAWRKQFAETFGPEKKALLEMITKDIAKPSDLGEVLPALTSAVIDSMDKVTALVGAYGPVLAAAIQGDECYESEILEAFAGVVGLGFPFFALADRAGNMIQLLLNLSQNKPTLTN